MEQDSDKLIQEQLKTLPIELQRAIALTPWRNFVGNVARANNLQGDSFKNLETEAMLVIYGFENQNDFVGNIMRELSLDISRATMIAGTVDKQVFSRISNKANELANEKPTDTLQSTQNNAIKSTTLAPSVTVENDLPMIVPNEKAKVALTFEDRKKLVPSIPDNKHHYEGGKDPYREQI